MNVCVASGAVLMFAAAILIPLILADDLRTSLIDRDSGPLPKDAIARLGSPRLRHAGEITALAFSPDSRWLASASSELIDGTARLWDAATGKERVRVKLVVPAGPLTMRTGSVALGFSADGKSLLVVDERTFRSIDISDGREIRRFDFSDDTPLAFRGTGRPLAGVGIAPNGASFVIAWTNVAWTGGQFAIYDVATRTVRARGEHSLQSNSPLSIEFSADSARCALCSSYPAAAVVVDLATAERIADLKSEDPRLNSIRFTPSGEIIGMLQSNTKSVRSFAVVDARSGRQLRTIDKSSDITAFAVSPDGMVIATANGSKALSDLIDASTGKTTGQFPTIPTLRRLIFSPNGKLLAGAHASSGVISVWDAPGRRLHRISPDPLHFFRSRFSPDGQALLLDSPERRLVDWRTGQILRRFATVDDPEHLFLTQPVLSPDLTVFAVADRRGQIRIADAESGKTVRTLEGHRVTPRVAFSGDGGRLASFDMNSTIRVWDVSMGVEIARFSLAERSTIHSVSLSQTGRIVAAMVRMSGAAESSLVSWDVDAKRASPSFQASAPGLGAFALSPNGRFLTCAGSHSRTQFESEWQIQLWDIKTSRQIHTLRGHKSQIASTIFCAFSPDNRWLATGDAAGRLRLWEVITGQETYRFEGHQSSVMPSFSPDGRLLVAASQEAPCFVWDIVGAAKPDERLDAEIAWLALCGTDARAAFLAYRMLVVNPQAAIPIVRRHLSELRGNDSARIEQFIRDLDAASFGVRERASAELLKIAERIEPRLIEVRDKSSLEARTRVKSIMDRLTRPSPERLIISRALGVLETIAEPECLQILNDFATGHPGDALTIEATESRDRLIKRGVK
jgi:WD40 repeat protein